MPNKIQRLERPLWSCHELLFQPLRLQQLRTIVLIALHDRLLSILIRKVPEFQARLSVLGLLRLDELRVVAVRGDLHQPHNLRRANVVVAVVNVLVERAVVLHDVHRHHLEDVQLLVLVAPELLVDVEQMALDRVGVGLLPLTD